MCQRRHPRSLWACQDSAKRCQISALLGQFSTVHPESLFLIRHYPVLSHCSSIQTWLGKIRRGGAGANTAVLKGSLPALSEAEPSSFWIRRRVDHPSLSCQIALPNARLLCSLFQDQASFGPSHSEKSKSFPLSRHSFITLLWQTFRYLAISKDLLLKVSTVQGFFCCSAIISSSCCRVSCVVLTGGQPPYLQSEVVHDRVHKVPVLRSCTLLQPGW